MIRFEFSALEDGPYFNLKPFMEIIRYGSAPPDNALAFRSFLVSPHNEVVTASLERAAGSRPIHGDKSWGTMRDKEVKHLNARGTISLPSSTFAGDYNETLGRPLAYNLSTKTWIVSGSSHQWGSAVLGASSTPSYEYTYNGEIRTVGVGYGEWSMRFVDDVGILISRIINPEVQRKSDGLVRISSARRGGMQLFKRVFVSGAWKLKAWTDYRTKLNAYFTGEEELALLAEGLTKAGGIWLTPVNYQRYVLADPDSQADSLIKEIRAHMGRTALHLDVHPVDFGDLAVECSAQTKFVDQNVLSLVFDVDDWTHIHRLWKSLRNSDGWKGALRAYHRVRKGKGRWEDIPDLFNPASSAYLFTKYAVLPSVSDVKRLLSGAERSSLYLKKQRLHSRRVTPIDDPSALTATHTAVLTVQCDTYPHHMTGFLQRVIGENKKWGIWPEIQNLWDILPCSFVLDWIIQFGDLFEDVTTYMNQEHYFPAQYCVASEKWEVSRSINSIAPGTQAEGVVYFSYYTRWISRELPLPIVSLEAEFLGGKHLLESTALVLQRL